MPATAPRPLHRESELIMNNEAYFQDACEKLFRSITGVFVDEKEPGRFIINTPVGQLVIQAMDDWIACRFLNFNLQEVATFLNARSPNDSDRLNKCSGKWNWHLWHVNLANAEYPYKGKNMRPALRLLAETVYREVEDMTLKVTAEKVLGDFLKDRC